MPEQLKHIVQKQLIDFEWKGERNQAKLLAELDQKFETTILPAIEKVFDQSPYTKNHIRFDKLELDLGLLSISDFNQRLGSIIDEKLSGLLRKALINPSAQPPSDATEAEVIPTDASEADAFFFYLEQGYIPWWGRLRHQQIKITLDILLNRKDEDLRQRFTQISKNEEAKKRLYRLIDTAQFDKLFMLLDPKMILRPTALLHSMIKAGASFKIQDAQKLSAMVYHAYWTVFNQTHEIHPEKLLEESIISLMRLLQTKGVLWSNFAAEVIRSAEIEKSLKKTGTIQNILKKVQDLQDKSSADAYNTNDIDRTKTHEKERSDNPKEKPFRMEKDADRKPLRTLDKAMVLNGGCILFWPYLDQLFQSLDIIQNNTFYNDESATKALLMIDSMVFGQGGSYEDGMLLNKIICGLEPSFALEPGINLSEEEFAQGTEVLQALINHWTILGNTSIEGLQDSFLKRKAVLEPSEEGWKLILERKSIDVLLASLPFSISVIKLPWMNEILRTEW